MGKSIPVYRGAQKPWVRQAEYAPDIHGISGLDGTSLLPIPISTLEHDKTYLEAMEEAILTNEGEISFLSTGCLTSTATLLRDKPYLKEKIKYISIMGGGFDIGNKNINCSAEFNIWADPHAANFVFHDPHVKDKCILVPLNLTHTAIATETIDKEILGDGSSNLRRLFFELFQYFRHTYKDLQGFDQGPPVHDPLTLMPLLEFFGWSSHSDVQFDYKRMDINVVDDVWSPDAGRTYSIKDYPKEGKTGTIVGLHLNIPFFWEQVLAALTEVDKTSTIEI